MSFSRILSASEPSNVVRSPRPVLPHLRPYFAPSLSLPDNKTPCRGSINASGSASSQQSKTSRSSAKLTSIIPSTMMSKTSQGLRLVSKRPRRLYTTLFLPSRDCHMTYTFAGTPSPSRYFSPGFVGRRQGRSTLHPYPGDKTK